MTEVTSPRELSSDQKYVAGYFNSHGEFTDAGRGATVSRDWALNRGYERIGQAFSNETLVLRGTDDEQFYDVREAVASQRYGGPYSYAQQTTESRETVFNTRGQNE